MLASALLATLAASMALAMPADVGTKHHNTIQKRDCYGSGESWGEERDWAYEKVEDTCTEMGLDPVYFPNGKVYAKCWKSPYGNKRVNFKIENTSDLPSYLTQDECVVYLRREITGCPRGGHRTVGAFEYTCVSSRSLSRVLELTCALPLVLIPTPDPAEETGLGALSSTGQDECG